MHGLFFAILVITAAEGALGILPPSSATPTKGSLNSTAGQLAQKEVSAGNSTEPSSLGTRISSIIRDLPTLKIIVIFVCGFTGFLIVCLVIKVVRSGRRIRKTRKYDIITTPAERVEMAPLNADNDDEEDSTVFDVKYR
ncbi:membrane protein FAM174B [Latimeria chalumnae]|uniref:Family with sequence similarity 174 member B n=1 Tax=Latimeria chalumnae TaxID=7897 RepID=M3XL63_LATCH|nr:PREDICTED: membrane protein FAM174B [Latimeria chalumnae]|eukprot:XP_005994025.1 PREDICTED: membrane protein FAM174B [Latimeria chalumnae]